MKMDLTDFPICDTCKDRSAVCRCMNCKLNNCLGCRRAHILHKAHKFHKFVHIKFVPKEKMQPEKRPSCRAHPEFTVEYYCTVCDMPVCLKCKDSRHTIHSDRVTHGLSEHAIYKRGQLQRIIKEKNETVIQSFKDLLVDLQRGQENFQKDFETERLKLREFYRHNYNQHVIDFGETDIDVKPMKEKYSSQFLQKILFVQEQLNMNSTTLQKIHDSVVSCNESEILLRFKPLRERLDSIQYIHWLREKFIVEFKRTSTNIPNYREDVLSKQQFLQTFTFEARQELQDVVSFARLFETKLPLAAPKLTQVNWDCSITSGRNVHVSFGNYLMSYNLDNRRSPKVNGSVRPTTCVNISDVIKGVTSDLHGNVFVVTDQAIKSVTQQKQPATVARIPKGANGIVVSSNGEFILSFLEINKLQKYTPGGTRIAEYKHPSPGKAYRPKDLALNCVNEIFFADGESLVTVLDKNGKLKTEFQYHFTQSFARVRMIPVAIATSSQRHLYVIDRSQSGSLHVFTEDGKVLRTVMFKQILGASCIVVDNTNDVWTGSRDGRIRVYRSYSPIS